MANIFGKLPKEGFGRSFLKLSKELDQLVDLRCQNEVRLSQPVNGMRPGRDLDLAPAQQNVGMMALLFGDLADATHESQGRLEIRKLEAADDVMLVDNLPQRRFGQLTMELCELGRLEGRHAAAAGNAVSTSQRRSAQRETPRTEYPRP
jgi:hypothetical protein